MKGEEFVSLAERGGLVTLVLWVSGLIIVFSVSSVLSTPELESGTRLLVLLNIVSILFMMMLSMQMLVSRK